MSASPEMLATIDAWWRAANYLSVGQIFLLANPLLREPLGPQHIHQLGTQGFPRQVLALAPTPLVPGHARSRSPRAARVSTAPGMMLQRSRAVGG